jgi:VanZ family protein
LQQNNSRVVAWLLLLAIVVLSLVTPSLRPTTAPHQIEHAAIFLATGISFGMAYFRRKWLLSIGAIIFCAVIEIAQLYVPGRHARLSDFVVDATAAVLGVVAGRILLRTVHSSLSRRRVTAPVQPVLHGAGRDRLRGVFPVLQGGWCAGRATALLSVTPSRDGGGGSTAPYDLRFGRRLNGSRAVTPVGSKSETLRVTSPRSSAVAAIMRSALSLPRAALRAPQRRAAGRSNGTTRSQ